MLKVVMWIVIILGVGIGGILIYAATLSDDFAVARTVNMKASPAKIFPLIDDLKSMNSWNPFAMQDPTIKIDYAAATVGKGASYSWTSNGQAGQGSLSISDSRPNDRIDMKLHMDKPMKADNDIVFALVPKPDGTTDVTWSMTGTRPYIGKVLAAIFSMDKMVGTPFAQGLRNLQVQAERP